MEEIKITKRAVFLNMDQVVLPRKLTAENGAKYLLSGEFFETIERECHCLDGDGSDEFCHDCGGDGYVNEKVTISWTTIKAIHDKIVEGLEVKL